MSGTPPKPVGRQQLLLLEDEPGLRRSLQLLLHGQGYAVRAFASAAQALADDGTQHVSLLVADYRLADGDGLNVLRTLRARGWQGRAVLISGFADAALREAASREGFAATLEKPVRPHRLLAALQVDRAA